MPGYGVSGSEDGLLPWSWALTRLRDSHNYWVATVWPDGRPHTMPVWAIWDDGVLWFSSSLRSRKIRNIVAGSDVSMSTEDPRNPVVLEGSASIVTETPALQRFLEVMNAKYSVSYTMDFMDPAKNATVRVAPRWAFGVADGDFGGSPTRWELSS
jgi:PPOX class probable F420-dependent enzyme